VGLALLREVLYLYKMKKETPKKMGIKIFEENLA
jgi:hypothetical protein